MSANSFTWHTDQNDIYNGNQYGSTTLSGTPTQFNKKHPYGLSMTGAAGDSLTLQVTASGKDAATYWGDDITSSNVSKFDILSGTFAYRSQGATLYFGDRYLEETSTVRFTVTGQCILQSRLIAVVDLVNTINPLPQISIRESGVFSVLTESFSGGFDVSIADRGKMKVKADVVSLTNGVFQAYGSVPDGEYSLDLTPSVAHMAKANNISLFGVPINCGASAKARLRSTNLTLEDANIRAEGSAAIVVACNALTVTGSSRFILSNGTATFTFSNENGTRKFPVDYLTHTYPQGMFNFIWSEGLNLGTFRFRAVNDGDARQQYSGLLSKGYFAIEGTTYTGTPINGRKISDYDFDGTYLKVSLVKA